MSTNSIRAGGVPSATVRQVLAASDALVIDVRAPIEHAQDCFPGALSLPLFDDGERALIGTAYRHASPELAFTSARELLREHIEPLVRAICASAGHELGEARIEQRFLELTSAGLRPCSANSSRAPCRRCLRLRSCSRAGAAACARAA